MFRLLIPFFCPSISMSDSVTIPMPPLSAFIKQAEITREALKNFSTVSGLVNAPNIIKPALADVLHATVSCSFFSLRLNFSF